MKIMHFPRDWCSSAWWGSNSGAPETPPIHHSAMILRGLRGGILLDPHYAERHEPLVKPKEFFFQLHTLEKPISES